METSLRQSLALSQGDPSIFLSSTTAVVLYVATVVILASVAWSRRRGIPVQPTAEDIESSRDTTQS